MKRFFILLFFIPVLSFAEPMYSPTWGFFIDLPEGYEYVDGDAKDRFSFKGPGGAMFDAAVYYGRYENLHDLMNDVNKSIGNKGDVDYYRYNNRQAAIMELKFGDYHGWAIAVELDKNKGQQPMLLALAYGLSAVKELELFHISALDSICPSREERRYPGPVIDYSYPRGGQKKVVIQPGNINVMVRENDAEAAQVFIEREFQLLQNYVNSQKWQNAWIRYYRSIYRDSYDRIANAASMIVRSWGGPTSGGDAEKRAFAQRAFTLVQGYKYERNPRGSDFINLVTAITEGRGDCDSRAMICAILLSKADMRAAMMISRQYSHAMGLVDVNGTGARFESYGTKWLVAETTANVDIGLIAEEVSDPNYWLGVVFE
ncbi:hypothetical protein R84B8_02418 [Treponema sp. R8-4-B8]